MKRREQTKHPDLGFQIAPMIDVVFVIMLFFMVMAGDVKTEQELRMKLPGDPDKTTVTDSLPPEELTIGVATNGEVTLNDDPIDTQNSADLPNLTRQIRLIAANAFRSKSKVLVTISSEPTAKHERNMQVMNALKKANAAENVTFSLTDSDE